MKHFNLLKPLSRFYHMVNLAGIMVIWLIVNLIIAALVQLKNANEDVPIATFIAGIIIASIIGHILIMLITKLFYILYMINIESTFAEKEKDVKPLFKKTELLETEKIENQPMLNNMYNVESETPEGDKIDNLESKDQKWDNASMSSHKRPGTARTLLSNESKQINFSRGSKNKIMPIDTTNKDDIEVSKKDPLKIEYIGDPALIQDESSKIGNMDKFIFLLAICAFMTFFSCIYTYNYYNQSVILS